MSSIKLNKNLIAPCGMNCSLCYAYLRKKNRCPGCRVMDKGKPITRTKCRIKNCQIIKKKSWKYCSTKCSDFPCSKIRSLDKRYRTKYNFSMIKNLRYIEEKGIKRFIENQKRTYFKGNKIFCIHHKKYIDG